MLIDILILLNRIVGFVADVVFAPIAWLPGWLSVTLIGAVSGVVMLWTFKHTSNQPAIKRTRDGIKSNLLALSLFRDDLRVCLRCQGSILRGAGCLLLHAVLPMLVMAMPITLLLSQMALWYQARPLNLGEEAVVSVHLATNADVDQTDVELLPATAVKMLTGPVRVPSKQIVCWNVVATEAGLHQLSFRVADQTFTKDVAIGSEFMPTSPKRPDRRFAEVLANPREIPFAADSPVQSIEIVFPDRESWTSGTDSWVIYWFLIGLIVAYAARPFLNVNI